MSLINDALRKAAQQQAPPPAATSPHLRPAEPEQKMRHSASLALPIAFTVVALLLLLAIWVWSQKRDTIVVRAQPSAAEPAFTAEPASGAAALVPPAQTASGSRNPLLPGGSLKPELVTARDPGSPATVAAPDAAGTVPTQAGGSGEVPLDLSPTATASPAVVTNTPPVPAPPKLMGIIYNPSRPSAVINGKTVFLGDKVGGLRVQSITADTCLLVGGGKTNRLTLEE